MSIQDCSDLSEAIELCERYNLYLKPWWRVKISVQLPTLKSPGKAISTWKVMEKLKTMIKPDEFLTLKVSKTNLVLIQFEGEVEKKAAFKRVLQKVQSNTMKLDDFSEVLKIRAAEAKLIYPTRHDWDSFFRDAKNINEMKPGERPDTIYLKDLPVKWFLDHPKSGKPNEHVLKKVFEAFGVVRQVAIPETNDDDTFGKVNNFGTVQVFEAYVQYAEYFSFVKAMDSLKGMKLVYKSDSGKIYSAELKVDFDKTKYLSDKSILQRTVHRRLSCEKKVPAEEKKIETPKITKEEPPKKETIQKKKTVVESPCEKKHIQPKKDSSIAKAKETRKKEATNMLKVLFQRAGLTEMERIAKEKEKQILEERLQQQKLMEMSAEAERKHKEEEEKLRKKCLKVQEKVLREKCLKKLKMREQLRTEELREKLRKKISGHKKLKSVLAIAPNSSNHNHHMKKRLKS